MVVSISKIPDRIQRRNLYSECSRIMDISEQVYKVHSTTNSKDTVEIAKMKKRVREKAFEL
jgi:hypothetical protein